MNGVDPYPSWSVFCKPWGRSAVIKRPPPLFSSGGRDGLKGRRDVWEAGPALNG